MKRILLWLVLIVGYCLPAKATIYRWGYPGTAIAGVDFAWNDFASLYATANANDTIQVYQQNAPLNYYQTIELSKPLVLIGYGFMLDKNTGLQVVNMSDTLVNSWLQIQLHSGAQGSKIHGLCLSVVQIEDVDNILIKRCRIKDHVILYNQQVIANLTIMNCASGLPNAANSGFSIYSGSYGYGISNLKIVNNWMAGVTIPGGSSGTIANNVFMPNTNWVWGVTCNNNGGATSNVLIKNNIITNDVYGGCFIDPNGNTGLIKNNVFAYPALNCTAVIGNGNIYGVSMVSTFVNWNDGYIYGDAQLTLAAGAAALTAGKTNANATTQAGLFGGETTELYKLSGIPEVPSFYSNTFASAPSNASSTFTGTVSTRSNLSGVNITRFEYFIDTDPGYGNATLVSSFTPSTNIINKTISFNISSLSVGMHQLVCRSRDANGNWSLNHVRFFYKQPASASAVTLQNLSRIEYFIDNDPGYGQATSVSFTPSTNVSSLVIGCNMAALSSGIHQFCIRARDAGGRWSLINKELFYKPYPGGGSGTTLPNITSVEYYIDNDPGFGNATALSVTASTDISSLVIPISTTTLSAGIHQLCVRAKDGNGSWSLNNKTLFYKPYTSNTTTTTLPNLQTIEWFIDEDPGIASHSAYLPRRYYRKQYGDTGEPCES